MQYCVNGSLYFCVFFFCGGGGFFFFTSAPLIAFAILEKYHGVEIFHTIYLATGPGYLLKLRKWSYTFNGHHLIQLENVILRLENSGVFSFEVRKGVPWCTLRSESYWERYKHARLSLERLCTLRHPTGNKRHFSLCNSFPVCYYTSFANFTVLETWYRENGRIFLVPITLFKLLCFGKRWTRWNGRTPYG